MSFLDQAAPPPDPRTIVVVGGIHVALGAALIFGLAGPLAEIIEPPYVGPPTFTPEKPKIPPPPPEPSKDQTQKDPVKSIVTAPQPPLDLTRDAELTAPLVDLDDINDTIGTIPNTNDGEVIDIEPFVAVDPPQKFNAVGAKPRNNPGAWATTNDYPRRDLRERNEGITGFRLSIAANGRVSGCQVLSSSGHKGLDAATCELVSKRARFDAAINSNGDKVPGSYAGSIRWVIPK